MFSPQPRPQADHNVTLLNDHPGFISGWSLRLNQTPTHVCFILNDLLICVSDHLPDMYQITYQVCICTEAIILRVLFHGFSSRRLCFDLRLVNVGFVGTYWLWNRALRVFIVFTASIIRCIVAVLGEYVKRRGPQIEEAKELVAQSFFTLIESQLFFAIFKIFTRIQLRGSSFCFANRNILIPSSVATVREN
jgi:hypothetical protein